ncbi:MAG: hypothetical protein C4340_02875 [Armatimonadota bacterium]
MHALVAELARRWRSDGRVVAWSGSLIDKCVRANHNLGTVLLALRLGNWIIAFYALLFCCGLLFTSGMTVAQTR